MHTLHTKGFSSVGVILILVAIGFIGGVGYFVYSVNTTDNEAVNNTSSENAQADEATAENESETATNNTYTSAYQDISFEYPSSWSLEERDTFEGLEEINQNQKTVILTSPNGFTLRYLDELSGVGGGCDDSSPNVVITSVEEIAGASSVYLAENQGTLALSDEITASGDTGTCLVYPTVSSRLHGSESAISFGTSVQYTFDAFSVSEQDDVETARTILKSFTFNN